MNPLEIVRGLGLRERARWLFGLLDLATVVPTAFASAQMRLVRRLGEEYLPMNRAVLHKLGVVPAVDRYYDPFFSRRHLRRPLSDVRNLRGLDLRVETYPDLLTRLSRWQTERLSGAVPNCPGVEYRYDNGTYGGYDASVLYAFVRELRPRRIVEVGGGNSTKVLVRALTKNATEGAPCHHTCIEPFEMPWLENAGVHLVRQKLEEVGVAVFGELGEGDLVFVDTSHVLRPQGDVLFAVQEVLPALAKGVVVHVHDIFTPRDYPEGWLIDRMLFWNEQYLLESFLTLNPAFEVLLASNHAFIEHREVFDGLRPEVALARSMQPTSFWFRKR